MSGKFLAGVGQVVSVRSASVSQKGDQSENQGDGVDFGRALGEAVSAQTGAVASEKKPAVSSGSQEDAGGHTADDGQSDTAGPDSDSAGVLLVQAVLAAGLLVPAATAAVPNVKDARAPAADGRTGAVSAGKTAVSGDGEPAAGRMQQEIAAMPATAPESVGAAPNALPAQPAATLSAQPTAAAAKPAAVPDETPAVSLPDGQTPAVTYSAVSSVPRPAAKPTNASSAAAVYSAAANGPQTVQAHKTATPAVAEVSAGRESARAQPRSSDTGDSSAAAAPTAWPASLQTAAPAAGVSAGGGAESHPAVQGMARQIAAALADSPASRGSQLRVHLSPADLGGINLRFATENGRITLQITADNSQTGALLTAHLDELSRSLAHSGVTMDRTEVFCQTGTGSQFGGQPGSPFGGQADTGGHRNARQDAAAFSAPSVPENIRPAVEPAAASGTMPGTMSIFA